MTNRGGTKKRDLHEEGAGLELSSLRQSF